jgi:DNA-binding response OmpR family regulator
MKILLADDDTEMLDVTCYFLRKHGYEVAAATDGAQAVQRWRDEQPDLVLLDIGLPRLSGYEVCRKIRATSKTPIIMVTGKDEDDQVVEGFSAGADDYVTKPFSHRQLVMRIRAVLGRASGRLAEEPPTELQVGEFRLDLQSHQVTRGDVCVQLTPSEFRVFYMLAITEGRVVLSRRLVEYGWGYLAGEPALLKTHICHLRRKLAMTPGAPGYIRTIRWVGYLLTRS